MLQYMRFKTCHTKRVLLKVALLNHKVPEKVSAMRHELASSFRLFRLQKFVLWIIKNFSKRQITILANALLHDSPFDGKRFVVVF